MSRHSKKKSPPASAPRNPAAVPSSGSVWLIAARLLLAIALVVSAYLAWISLSHGSAIGCGPESDCDRVLSSRWARWFGVPVSVFAVLVDALTLWGTFQITRGTTQEGRARGWFAVLFGSSLILGAALWFVGLQMRDGYFCMYCMTAHVSGAAAAIVLLARGSRGLQLPASLALRAGLFAAAGLVLLVAGQFLHRPKTGVERKDFATGTNLSLPAPPMTQAVAMTSSSATNLPSKTNTAATPQPASATNSPPAQVFTPGAVALSAMQRPFSFYEGRVAVDLEDVPVLGSPTNAQILISLFDYTCHHCREMHSLLEEAQRTFSNKLAIVNLPAPLDAECNRTMKATSRAHTNACNYARLGLIVWRGNRDKHHEFDQFMFTGPEPPPFHAAVGRAVQLIGTNAITRAAADPWVEERLQFGLALYEAAYKKGEGRMPQMIVGRSVAVGTYPRDELFKLLADNLGLKTAP